MQGIPDLPFVSVVIPTRRRMAELRRALASFECQSVSRESFEVVVSVDDPDDGTWEMLSATSTPYVLRKVRGPERGRAGACNAGIAAARGDVVVILDDDMQVAPEFIASHRQHHSPDSRRCVLGPVPVATHVTSTRAAAYVKAKFAAHLATLADPSHRYTARDFYSGNASLRRAVLLEVGGFDESFAIYGNEDVELFIRLRAADVSMCFEPRAEARQEYGKDLRGLVHDTLAKGQTTVLLASLHPDWFGELRLAAPGDGSRPWLAARAALLGLSRCRPRVRSAVFALAVQLEQMGLWRQPLFYRAVLDYAFWCGVDMALTDVQDKADLDRLAKDIKRGPIDRLLHG